MTVQLAFIGAGGIASVHLDNLESNERADVVAVCDIDDERATAAAETHGAAAFTDHHEMYEEASFDAVVVGIPPFAHEDQERLAVEHGADLFVEKPLALDSETVRENAAAVAESDRLAQVGHMVRYVDSVQRAKELVGDRTVALVDGHWWCGIPGEADHWWRKKSLSGGQVVEQATHTYDAVRYFAGDVESVSAVGGKEVCEEELDFEDSTSASMRHETGAISHVSATSTSARFSHGLSLTGEGFSLELDVGADTLVGTVDGEEIAFEGDGDAYETEITAFLEAVETRDESLLRSPYEDARKTFETTLAVERALETGESQRVTE
ncbi:Gfo/Idh/MocA family oxidoreductase [Halogeometricum sp. S1BR25-6]|uniref:Gfo/Idh/MocA family oxidoreductase n=1 Tax=Halogeometricum salsisoli TaxID=2950536 RepID=A0ABU2GIL7_9EURY|nr:Gfo/Idh/MocA family oxidoreductase [Halogeometricum sp. S1BR25-6]MDS0300645.1 Gfo/Idh/MocA family oxidoreductase [Halogeometricum sp. S1BR25-6]